MNKEIYYSSDIAVQKIKWWIEIARECKSHLPFRFSSENAALLVLDMQKMFLDENSHAFVPSAPHIISNIQKAIDFFSSHNRPTIFSRHISETSDRDMMGTWWRDPILETEEKSQIIAELNTSRSKTLIKHQYSAFFNTELDGFLRSMNVAQLVITGVLTHLCCESTARDAFMLGYKVFMLVDGTATYNELLHVGSIRAISHGFGICLSSKSIV